MISLKIYKGIKAKESECIKSIRDGLNLKEEIRCPVWKR
jgi:hypothetical protein